MGQENNDLFFDKNDKIELDRIMVLRDPSEWDLISIFKLYIKYIDSSAKEFVTSGCNCNKNIEKTYFELVNWYRINFNNFL